MTSDHKPLTIDDLHPYSKQAIKEGFLPDLEDHKWYVDSDRLRSAVEGLRIDLQDCTSAFEALQAVDKRFPVFKDTGNTSYPNGGGQ